LTTMIFVSHYAFVDTSTHTPKSTSLATDMAQLVTSTTLLRDSAESAGIVTHQVPKSLLFL